LQFRYRGSRRESAVAQLSTLGVMARNHFAMLVFELSNMKKYISLVVLASFILALAGCSKHLPTTAVPKTTDLGVVEVSDGIPSSHRLADGRACVMTPTVLKDGRVKLGIRVGDTNAASIHTLTISSISTDIATFFAFDQSNIISLTLHISK
jgi:hypothetical protein